MANIFIDTNIYLRFFESERIAKLIPVLKNLRPRILVTSLIVDEVERNKSKCFNGAVKDKLKTPKWALPDPLLKEDENTKILETEFAGFQQKAEALRRKIEAHFLEMTKGVVESKDHISTELTSFFGDPAKPSEEELKLARFRKEVNNPPGKLDDPLGDELHWEQFLTASMNEESVWIASTDNDYFIGVGDEVRLNPLLLRDILAHGRQTKAVYCFRTLADLVKHFTTTNKITPDKLPSAENLTAIAEAERETENSRVAQVHNEFP